MDLKTLIQLATLVSVVVGVIGLLISARGHKRQVSAAFMLEFTKRIDDIMRTLPPSIWAPTIFPDKRIPDSPEEVRLGILRCINTIAQLHTFSRAGYFPRNIWKRHRKDYARLLQSPLFVREWQTLKPLFTSDPAFCRYVESIQKGADEETAYDAEAGAEIPG